MIGNIYKESAGKYKYIVSHQSLMDSYIQSMADLNYPLQKESARDRYLIYNQKGLDQMLTQKINALIEECIPVLERMIVPDIVAQVHASLRGAGVPASSIKKPSSPNWGRFIGKAVANTVNAIIKELPKQTK